MKIFILEDYEERTHTFSKEFVKDELVICNNAELALTLLAQVKFDLIFLDHDLEGEAYVDSDYPNTGYRVARELQNTLNADTRVIVHSYNPAGVELMMEGLLQCGGDQHVLRIFQQGSANGDSLSALVAAHQKVLDKALKQLPGQINENCQDSG